MSCFRWRQNSLIATCINFSLFSLHSFVARLVTPWENTSRRSEVNLSYRACWRLQRRRQLNGIFGTVETHVSLWVRLAGESHASECKSLFVSVCHFWNLNYYYYYHGWSPAFVGLPLGLLQAPKIRPAWSRVLMWKLSLGLDKSTSLREILVGAKICILSPQLSSLALVGFERTEFLALDF